MCGVRLYSDQRPGLQLPVSIYLHINTLLIQRFKKARILNIKNIVF